MLDEWRTIPAEAFCTSVRDGTHDSPKPASQGRFLVTSRHITSGRLDLANAYLISQEDFDAINKRSKVDRWDVLLSMIGTVGKPCLVKEEPNFAIKNIGLFKSKGEYEGKWLYYYLRSPYAQQIIREQSRGTTQVYIPLRALREFPVLVPDDPKEMQSIAYILGTLDDKIELNRRMDQTLEGIARAIFKSWFVDFDPVRAKLALSADGTSAAEGAAGRQPLGLATHIADLFPDAFEASELGKIPKEWEAKTLATICRKPQYGYTASANDDEIGPKFLRITDINKKPWIDWKTVPYCQIQESDYQKYRLYVGDILIARMADPGHSVVIEEQVEAVFASYLIRFQPRNASLDRYLQYWLRSHSYWNLVRSRQSGTTRPSLNARVIGNFKLLVPSSDVAEAFKKAIDPLRNKIVTNVQQSNALAALRDTLLPRLISGELRVPDAERIVGRCI